MGGPISVIGDCGACGVTLARFVGVVRTVLTSFQPSGNERRRADEVVFDRLRVRNFGAAPFPLYLVYHLHNQ